MLKHIPEYGIHHTRDQPDQGLATVLQIFTAPTFRPLPPKKAQNKTKKQNKKKRKRTVKVKPKLTI